MLGVIRENISRNITKYRTQLGLSQKELGSKVGVKPSTVSNWEQGANSPDIEVLFELCKVFNIPIDEIYGVDEDVTEYKFIKICDLLEDSGFTVEPDTTNDYDYFLINSPTKGTVYSMQKQDLIDRVESIINEGEEYKERFIIDKIKLLFTSK